MTFNRDVYIRVLTEAGIGEALALAHADAVEGALMEHTAGRLRLTGRNRLRSASPEPEAAVADAAAQASTP